MTRQSPAATTSSGRRFMLHVPAVRALLIQCAAFLAVATLAPALDALMGFSAPVLCVALIQGSIAAVVSRCFRMAFWWVGIHCVFPVAVIAMQVLQLPPITFLLAFLLFLGLFWSTFRTQVPFYPSRPSTWRAVARLLPEGRAIRFIDVGSGLGGLSMHLARHRPDSTFMGTEIAPLPWLVSVLRARVSRSRARFIRNDYGDLDFSQYDVVFAYLSPVAMPGLWKKAKAEMRTGTLLLSYEFPIAGEKWNIIDTFEKDGPALYGWWM